MELKNENLKFADNFTYLLESLNMKETAESFKKEFTRKIK